MSTTHTRYSRLRGYRHATIYGIRGDCERLQILLKYHAIVAQLVALEQGALLLLLDPFSVALDPRALHDVAHGRGAILTMQTLRLALTAVAA
ncbi:hypothetical protein [Burkholderia sp. LMG 32019]|uniref:hypothetical protein n=1 Tax=Burkholderia sp. LMG 32019 TaxID=3158173 RepID=UPI003C2EEB77